MTIFNKLAATLVLSMAAACVSPTDSNRGDSANVAPAYMAVGTEAPIAIGDVGLDSETRAAIVDELGFVPENIEDLGPREAGVPRVALAMAPGDGPVFWDGLTARMSGNGPGPRDLKLVFDDGDDTALIGLLLPAVQKVRAAATRGSMDSFFDVWVEVEVDDAKTFDYEGALPPPRGAAPDSFFDISVELSPSDDASEAEATRYQYIFPGMTGESLTFDVSSGGTAQLSGGVTHTDRWDGETAALADEGVLSNGEFIIWERSGDTRVPRMGFYVKDVLLDFDDGDVGVTGGAAQLITYTGLENQSTTLDLGRSVFSASYDVFDEAPYDEAQLQMANIREAMLVDAEKTLLEWHGGIDTSDGTNVLSRRDDIVAALGGVSVAAGDVNGMACTAAVPVMVAVGQTLGGTDRPLLLVETAAKVSPAPGKNNFGTLAVGELVEIPASAGDPSAACAAAISLSFYFPTVDTSGIDSGTIDALSGIADGLEIHRPARLDRLIVEFIEHMDSVKPGEGSEEWFTAAKTKADILIESLGNQRAGSAAAWGSAKKLLAL